MEWWTTFLIAVGLAMDTFAVCLGVGTSGQAPDWRSKFRLVFHFGWFQAMMTALGWLVGSTIVHLIDNFDHWVALAMLAYVGISMIRSGLSHEEERIRPNPSKGFSLVMLSVATSLDALAVGLSMAMTQTPVLYPSILIGAVSASLSTVGLLGGARLGAVFGKRMEIVGGVILIVIGLRVVYMHLFA
jgi:putative Mn2+ efflux pump MntP